MAPFVIFVTICLICKKVKEMLKKVIGGKKWKAFYTFTSVKLLKLITMTKWFRHPIKKNCWISKEEYFNILFGEEYMESTDKGTLKEYQEKSI